MSETFLLLSPDEQASIFQTCAAQLGRRPEHLEKDVWICWVLQNLFGMPRCLPMAFKGGTSLSKVFDAIRRFSEDVDVTIDYRALDAGIDPFAPGLSKTAQKKFSETLRAHVKAHTHDVMLPYFENLLAPFATQEKRIELSDDGETMRIYYPSVYGERENVLLEFGGRNVTEPNEEHSIRPYIAEEIKELKFPSARVRVLSPVRTFWEKATLIHVECHRSEPRLDASRMSRHWSDLAALADHEIGKRSLSARELLAEVVKHKKVFFYTATANYDACLEAKMRLVPDGPLLDALKADFGQMVKDRMFDLEPPRFDKIVSRLKALEQEINGRDR
ncbi:MAG: nucleotidyl transferase AbiEii/AbiGii toxin family protein [Terriglobia bacterium]